jgi:hypothetical protein
VPLTSTPVAQPTAAPLTTKPTLQPLTYPPTSSPTSSCNYKLPKIITLKPFELTLSISKSSNISYLDDINLQEFTNVTDKYLNNFLSNHSIPREERMLFDRLRLTLNLKKSSVELSKFKVEYGGAANVSIVSLCNETNVTLSDRQKSFFNGLVLSAFDNQQAEKYDSMLHASLDPTVSQLSFADAREVRRVTQDSRVTRIASNTFFCVPVMVSSFAAVVVIMALVLVAHNKYRSKTITKKEVRPKSNLIVAHHPPDISRDSLGFQLNEIKESANLPCGGIMYL